MEADKKTHLLEINLISAQNLINPSSATNLRRRTIQTYAVAYVDPSYKLRTQTRTGPNPTWNEKFLFRVKPDFLSSQTSSVSVSIFSVGFFSDYLIGTVRFLLPTTLSSSIGTPSFSAVQIRRTSGRFHGVLNLAAAIADGVNIANDSPAICVRDLSAESVRRQQLRRNKGSESSDCDISDGYESSASTSSSSSTLKEINRDLGSVDGGGLLCCLGMQKRVLLGPSDQILRGLATQMKENSN